jgi:hypothetical protein
LLYEGPRIAIGIFGLPLQLSSGMSDFDLERLSCLMTGDGEELQVGLWMGADDSWWSELCSVLWRA